MSDDQAVIDLSSPRRFILQSEVSFFLTIDIL